MQQHTIIATASGHGGALACLRVSGPEAVSLTERFFRPVHGRPLGPERGFTLHYGNFNGPKDETVDDVLVSLFRAPHSYTGEDLVEISCHASPYIVRRIIELYLSAGAHAADPGEFTLRAYLNGKMDLVQAEGVADLIASTSEANHRLAVNQLKGGYSKEFADLRAKLLRFISLIELELDFGEEDVQFADRDSLRKLLLEIKEKIEKLTASFHNGDAIKNGVPVAIVGRPNAGKSTLLNALLREDRAIVSEIAGTTRDVIEDTKIVNGVTFRFIDTAGIRRSDDRLESLGIERTFDRMAKASIVLLVTTSADSFDDIRRQIGDLGIRPWQRLVVLQNKSELRRPEALDGLPYEHFAISAKNGSGLDRLEAYLSSLYESPQEDVIITNARHYGLLNLSSEGINRALEGLDTGLTGDFIAQDLRESLHHLGSLTGEITTDDILKNIFANFCIGK